MKAFTTPFTTAAWGTSAWPRRRSTRRGCWPSTPGLLMHKGTLPYSDESPAPYAGVFMSSTMGFLSQETAVRAAQGISLHDDDAGRRPARRSRSPTTRSSSTPTPNCGGRSPNGGSPVTARRSTSSTATPRPSEILAKLDEPLSMNFPNERRLRTSSSTSSRRPRARTTTASRSTSIRSASARPRRP